MAYNPLDQNWSSLNPFKVPEPDTSAADQARADEQARQARVDKGLASINEAFSQYDDDYYDKRGQAFLDYQTPQVQEQYVDALDQLEFALERQGRRNSGTSARKYGKANKEYGKQMLNLQSLGNQEKQKQRQLVQDIKGSLITQNEAMANPAIAASSAAARAGIINAPPHFEPLLDLFGNISEGLVTRQEAEERQRNRALYENMVKLFNNNRSQSLKG